MIEISNVDIISKLKNTIAQIHCPSSGVSLSGDSYFFKGLNTYLLYEICATILVNDYKHWDKYIEQKVISKKPADHNISWTTI